MSNDENPADMENSTITATAGQTEESIGSEEKRPLSPAAQRALAEAEARRKARDQQTRAAEREIGGRGGADPARFGDWEINGRAIDF
ncbi:DUF1674 domain-containing protein [Hoeflea alexandrii]|uniref:DUF1674 domain-containing protein n=1 Tax=Hoeflea alexandrii TaxID=288436 RepID=UPI0022AF0A37|nr:DUF1674 domain-containing protein [Hoeflea alexandrii]MCZ4289533.1 DUF1674 domain-containing protein [Hoeflea alexandrii]